MTKWLNENFPNYRSFVIAVMLACASGAYDYLQQGQFSPLLFIKAVLIAGLGYVVKDKLVTGGTVPQTPEAAHRAEDVDLKATKVEIQKEEINAPIKP